ncbi:MAG: response regulator [Chromatiales bacterium]|nr:response regulator [Chromatiales bacterium]
MELEHSQQQHQITGARVLLVEDNPINQQIAAELLGRFGLEVVMADNGQEALRALDSDRTYDLVLMDLQMPVMDGYLATEAIRQDQRWTNLPIIAMTAHDQADERARCLALGMSDHLSKPIDIDALHATLLRWVSPTRSKLTTSDAAVNVTPSADEETLPGINIKRALLLLGDNRDIYTHLVESFLKNHAADITQMRSAMASGDELVAIRLAHTLKGLAGSLGAESLAASALALELALKQQEAEALARLTTLDSDFEQVVASLRKFCARREVSPAVTGEAREVDTIQVLPLLQQFIGLVDSDLGEARRVLKTLDEALLNTPLYESFAEINGVMADYETDEAAELAQQMIKRLQGGG